MSACAARDTHSTDMHPHHNDTGTPLVASAQALPIIKAQAYIYTYVTALGN